MPGIFRGEWRRLRPAAVWIATAAGAASQNIDPTGIASAEAFGTPVLNENRILPFGIPSEERFAAIIGATVIAHGQQTSASTEVDTTQFDVFLDRVYLIISDSSQVGASSGLEDTPATPEVGIVWKPFFGDTQFVASYDPVSGSQRQIYAWRGTPQNNNNIHAVWSFLDTQESVRWVVIELTNVVFRPVVDQNNFDYDYSLLTIAQAQAGAGNGVVGSFGVAITGDPSNPILFFVGTNGADSIGAVAPLGDITDADEVSTGTAEQTGTLTGKIRDRTIALPSVILDTARNVGGLALEIRARTAVIQLTVNPTGIASAGAFGTPVLNENRILPLGLPSAEAIGTADVSISGGSQNVDPTGIASAQAMGTPALDLTLNPTGIASAQAIGTPALDLTINPNGIASAQAMGTPDVSISGGSQNVDPTGIASAQAMGIPSVEVQGIAIDLPTWTEAPVLIQDTTAPVAIADTTAPASIADTAAVVSISHGKATIS